MKKDETIREKLKKDIPYEKVLEVLKGAMDAEKASWAFCPGCNRKVKADFPDTRTHLTAAEFWFEHVAGKAPTAREEEKPRTDYTQLELEGLTDEELLKIAGSG